jgi:hypothetical protein
MREIIIIGDTYSQILLLNGVTHTLIHFYEQANHNRGSLTWLYYHTKGPIYKRRRKYKGPIYCKTGEGSLFSLAAMICQSVCEVFAQMSQNYFFKCMLEYFYFSFLKRDTSSFEKDWS